jgi:hypothetical protein
MTHLSFRLGAATLALGVLASCRDSAAPIQPPAPVPTEPLVVSTVTRAPIAGERLPQVRVAAAPAALAVEVTRPAFCATLASAGVLREDGVIAVVTQVGGDPRANCAPIPAVVVYGGLVTGLAQGPYRVDVYEAAASAAPRLLASTRVTVPPAAR